MDFNEIETLKAINELLQKQLHNVSAQQEEYFTLLNSVSENNKYNNAISDRIMSLSLPDQLKILRKLSAVGTVSKTLCEKYGVEVEEDDECL